MANDLVARLRAYRAFTYDELTKKGAKHHNALLDEAAVRIEELEKALEPFANAYVNREKWAENMYIGGSALRNSDLRAAARAYKGK